VVQFSGGEPTLHPQLLDFIALANRKNIQCVMLNTNGIRIANDPEFLQGLKQHKPHIYLQFDGFKESTYEQIRGRSDLLETKLRALDLLAEADMRVVLVAVIERGVNDDEIGEILEFGLRHPAVYGINFQVAFHAQRHIRMDPLQRMTIPDVLQAIDDQTHSLLTLKDFVPVPCCMPTCNFVTYALIQGDKVTSVPSLIPVDQYLDYLKNRTMPELNDELLQVLERLWSASAQAGGLKMTADILRSLGEKPLEDSRAAERCPSCQSHLPIARHSKRDLGRHIFMLSIRDFMDPWTFTLKNAMKCCVNFMTTEGKMVPFCSYNSVGYRERELEHILAEKSALPAGQVD
jgi:7,8-dihydro-6-hydroxymethylpterin dimethyltransferase